MQGEAGLSFRHSQGTLLWYLPQITGPGMALIDFDCDGQLDLFFVQGSGPDDGKSVARIPPSHLYRQDDGRFEECGARAGADSRGYGMAALAWDYNNDGYPDLAVTNYSEPTRLYENNGDGTFTERAVSAGIDGSRLTWASSLTAIDHDRDGLLDLFEGQYIDFGPAQWTPSPRFRDEGHGPGPLTLLPGEFKPLPSLFYSNQGDGTFRDHTQEAGLRGESGQTMGALAMDFDDDGWTDLMIANDGKTVNLVYQNVGGRFVSTGKGSFADEARGSMGFAVSDYDRDGTPDIVVSHWLNQPAMYRTVVRPDGNQRRVRFLDRVHSQGLGSFRPLVGWAVCFLEIDNDGYDDLLMINGHTNPPIPDPMSGRMAPQPSYLYRNQAGKAYLPETARGPRDPLGRDRVGRSAGFGDLNRDGLMDAALNNNNEPAEIWMHQPASASWIGFWPVGTVSNRDATGARLSFTVEGQLRFREVTSGESYFATNARHLLFGLGTHESPLVVTVRWPSGRQEEFRGLAVRTYHRLVEGTGVVSPPSSPTPGNGSR